jgi:hypothetical protein
MPKDSQLSNKSSQADYVKPDLIPKKEPDVNSNSDDGPKNATEENTMSDDSELPNMKLRIRTWSQIRNIDPGPRDPVPTRNIFYIQDNPLTPSPIVASHTDYLCEMYGSFFYNFAPDFGHLQN